MENKAVIVRTRKENTANVFLFTTPNYNNGNVLPTFIKPDKVADEINLKHFEGGMLSVVLTSHKSNGVEKYKVVEEVMFEKGLVVGICIFTEFSSCRSGSRLVQDGSRCKQDILNRIKHNNSKGLRGAVQDGSR